LPVSAEAQVILEVA